MTTPSEAPRREPAGDVALRRRFLLLASVVTVLSFLHFVDHVIRGQLVVSGGLNPEWNHSGWPFTARTDKPYLFPVYFVVIFTLLLGGIFFTARRKLWAGYWLTTSTVVAALLVFVHFIGLSSTAAETPSIIAMSHHNNLGSTLALIDLFGLIAVLVVLAYQALRTRQRSGRW